MVDGGEEDVGRERRNTVSTSEEIKGRNNHVILCVPIPGTVFGIPDRTGDQRHQENADSTKLEALGSAASYVLTVVSKRVEARGTATGYFFFLTACLAPDSDGVDDARARNKQ